MENPFKTLQKISDTFQQKEVRIYGFGEVTHCHHCNSRIPYRDIKTYSYGKRSTKSYIWDMYCQWCDEFIIKECEAVY